MSYRGNGFAASVIGCVLAAFAPAQTPTGRNVAEQPTEYGIRFTPGIARAMARAYAQDVLVGRYNLDASKVDQAAESVARRIMDVVHRYDDAEYAERIEQMVEGIMAGQAGQPGWSGVQPRTAKAMADAMRPIMPGIRDLVRGVAQDVRPMLGAKDQLKFGGDLMTLSTALNAFEDTLDRWEDGDVRPGENPFEPDGKPKLDESGHSRAYNAAVRMVRQDMEQGEWEGWKQYVEDARKLYGFDEGQAAGASSILNECLARAAQYTGGEDWRREFERVRLWMNLLGVLRVGQSHPLRYCLERGYGRLVEPVHAIGDELKQRIDAIPTVAQRRAADERILQMIGEQGFVENPDSRIGASAAREALPAGPVRSTPPEPLEAHDERGSANDETGGIRYER